MKLSKKIPAKILVPLFIIVVVILAIILFLVFSKRMKKKKERYIDTECDAKCKDAYHACLKAPVEGEPSTGSPSDKQNAFCTSQFAKCEANCLAAIL